MGGLIRDGISDNKLGELKAYAELRGARVSVIARPGEDFHLLRPIDDPYEYSFEDFLINPNDEGSNTERADDDTKIIREKVPKGLQFIAIDGVKDLKEFLEGMEDKGV